MRCRAEPDASVSKHPFLPQWQSISFSNTLICPNSPENPDFPVYILPSIIIPIPSPQLIFTKIMFFSPVTQPCMYSPYVIARVSLSMQTGRPIFSVSISANGRSEKLNILKLYPESGLTRPEILMQIFIIFSVLMPVFLIKLLMSLHSSSRASDVFSNL